jgi:hypothetical protein
MEIAQMILTELFTREWRKASGNLMRGGGGGQMMSMILALMW